MVFVWEAIEKPTPATRTDDLLCYLRSVSCGVSPGMPRSLLLSKCGRKPPTRGMVSLG